MHMHAQRPLHLGQGRLEALHLRLNVLLPLVFAVQQRLQALVHDAFQAKPGAARALLLPRLQIAFDFAVLACLTWFAELAQALVDGGALK